MKNDSFNGAAIFRPRKRPIRLSRLSFLLCFNGAAIFRPRKHWCQNMGKNRAYVLQWGRDLSTAETRESGSIEQDADVLQWGRDLSTAET